MSFHRNTSVINAVTTADTIHWSFSISNKTQLQLKSLLGEELKCIKVILKMIFECLNIYWTAYFV